MNKALHEFIKYAALNVLGMIGLSCYILADTFFVSKGLGTAGLAALNLAIPVYSLVHGTGLMLGMGAAARYSLLRAQKNDREARGVFTLGVISALVFSAFFVLAGLFFSESLALALGADGDTLQMTDTYIKFIFLFSPAFIMNNVLICFVRNDGQPSLSMAAMLSGSFSNVLLDYIFIFPLNMGMFGAVFATGLAPIISMSLLSLHWLMKKNSCRTEIKAVKPKELPKILSLGFPSLITELSAAVVMISFNSIILTLLGNIGVAAYGVIANLSLVASAVCTGIAHGVQPLFSRAYGGGNIKELKALARYSITSALAVASLIYCLVFFFASPITLVFNSENSAELQSVAERGIKLYFSAVFFLGFNILMSVFFTSINRPRPAHAASLMRGFALILPLAFLLSSRLGIDGVWLSFPLSEFMSALFLLAFFVLCMKNLSVHTEISGDKIR